MAALEILAGQVTAPSTTLTALTMNSGNSLTVRNAPLDSKIKLLGAWALNQATGQLQIRSPRMHDNVDGLQFNVTAADADVLTPLGVAQDLVSQDSLNVLLSGSATAGDIEMAALLVYYPDLPGIDGRFISAEDLLSKVKNLMTVTNTLSTGASGGYSGEEAINAEEDNFKANTDYALIGFETSVAANVIRWRGADTGNIGVGGPGNAADKMITRDWFFKLSLKYNLPLIPIFNSANKSNTLIDCHVDENGGNPVVNSIFAELSE